MPTGKMIVSAAQRVIGLGSKLAADIPAARFARFANGVNGPIDSNHPAFVFGHLAIYPAKVCEMLGDAEAAAAVAVPAGWDALFQQGKPCVDDPDGTVYPVKDALMDHYERGYAALLELVGRTPAEAFGRVNPLERMRASIPTLGGAVMFMTMSHTGLHLGQVSAWRRAEGLASAM